MNNKVSIIVPIYNVEQYLKKCVYSLINQTYKNIEIFLVDDGSPDNCGLICDELAKTDERIIVTHKENGGYGSVLEYSINNITGDYFLICDPDDWLEKDAVKKLIDCLIKNNVDLVVGRKKIVYIDGKTQSDKAHFLSLKEGIIYKDFKKFLTIPSSPHSKLYKTNLAKNISFPHKINNTDYLLYQVYLTRIDSAYFLDEEISNYFMDRPGNSFNEDCILTKKSLKSNAIVTIETLNQLNKNNELYKYSVLNLFYRSCNYLILMKKSNIENDEYFDMFDSVINSSKDEKRFLFDYYKSFTNNKAKTFIRYLVYINFYNKKIRDIMIKVLSIIKK